MKERKIFESYEFSNEFIDHNNGGSTKKYATVLLEIDYTNREFSIIPESKNDNRFLFAKSRKPELWQAVAELIIEAIQFGEARLKEDGE